MNETPGLLGSPSLVDQIMEEKDGRKWVEMSCHPTSFSHMAQDAVALSALWGSEGALRSPGTPQGRTEQSTCGSKQPTQPS